MNTHDVITSQFFAALELQFYNIRHLQRHTGELMERLGTRAHIDVDWIGMKPS